MCQKGLTANMVSQKKKKVLTQVWLLLLLAFMIFAYIYAVLYSEIITINLYDDSKYLRYIVTKSVF
jgi:hypothetical protein